MYHVVFYIRVFDCYIDSFSLRYCWTLKCTVSFQPLWLHLK